MKIKQTFLKSLSKIKSILKSWFLFLKKNYVMLLISPLIFSTGLFAVEMLCMPYDKQINSEIADFLTKQAEFSTYGNSFLSISMKSIGNSDYYIYSDSNLQNFQMRNQQYQNTRSYLFSAYKPYKNYCAFKYHDLECTAIQFESKFQKNDFYFKVNLLCGSFERFTDKNTIYISDTIAKKISNQNNIDSLVNLKINGSTITANAKSDQIFTIGGIIDTSDGIGASLRLFFGEDLIFISDFHSFQMNGACYLCGSTDIKENESIVNYAINTYKSSNNVSRYLQSGYSREMTFYEWNKTQSNYSISSENTRLNLFIVKIESSSFLLFFFGIVFIISSLILTFMYVSTLIQDNESCNKFLISSFNWFSSLTSIFIVSILFHYYPISSFVTKIIPNTRSKITSTVLFLTWIISSICLIIMPYIFKRKKIDDLKRF